MLKRAGRECSHGRKQMKVFDGGSADFLVTPTQTYVPEGVFNTTRADHIRGQDIAHSATAQREFCSAHIWASAILAFPLRHVQPN